MHFIFTRPSRSLISLTQFSLSSIFKPLPNSPYQTSLFSMAENAETFSSNEASAVDDDLKFGFNRPEMNTVKLAGTADLYDRHVFLCYKSHETWPPRVEDSETDPLPKLFSGALKARKNDINVKTRLTICEGRDGTELSDGDVLVFPEMIKYRGLTDSGVDSFVEDVLVKGEVWTSGTQEVLTGSHVFVCAHNSRDRRCGVCGPVLIEKFQEEIELRGWKDQVFVSACSHVGGHKYAGNLIIFSADPDGKISGHWYGYVAPNDVPELLDQHIGKGEVIERLWRGQMGASVEKTEEVVEQKIPNGNGLKNRVSEPREISSEKDNVTGCCQGANGFSCCRDGNLDEKKENKCTMLGRLSSWGGKWEQHEVLTAVAVAGAVATVAVAISFYRKSR